MSFINAPLNPYLLLLLFRAKLNTGNKTSEQVIYVIKGLRFPLLGRPAIEALNIVSVVHQVQLSADDVYERFPQVFEGLGKLDGEYNIDLKEDAKPYVVTTRGGLLSLKWIKSKKN